MWDSFQDWKVLDGNLLSTIDKDNNAAELIELNCLTKLWRLELMVNHIEQVPRDVRLFSSSRLLKQFKISIGDGTTIGDGTRYRYMGNQIKFESGERQLFLFNNVINIFHAIGALVENDITNLYLCKNSSTWEKMHINRYLSSMKDIVLKQCGSVVTLFASSQSFSQISQIEKTNGFGRYLQRIEIYECNQLRYLCSTSILKYLKNLQILILERCEMMEEVIISSNYTEQLEKIEFSPLETLKLCDLDQLTYFCKGINEIHFPRLRSLKLQRLEQFIFPTKIEIPHLKILKITHMPNVTTLCNIESFSLQKLKIVSCDNLKYVFSSSFVKNVPNLETLIISGCEMLKGVIGVSTATEEQWKKSTLFPKLINLELKFLDKLESFVIDVKDSDDEKEKLHSLFYCNDDGQVLFPRLQGIKTFGLSKINYIVGCKVRYEGQHNLDDDKLSLFPMLKLLELYCLSNLMHVYESNHPKLTGILFQNVKYLYMKDCGKVRYLFTGRVVAKQLELLEITNCPMMEVVVKNEAEKDDEGIVSVPNTHLFPLLEKLILINLQCLRSFCDVGCYTWDFPSFTRFIVSECPKLKALSPGYSRSSALDILMSKSVFRDILLRDRKVEFKNDDDDDGDRSGSQE